MRDARDGIAFELKSRGFKQSAIALKAGLTEQQLSDIVNKRRKMDANEMISLCRAMGTDLNSLFQSDQDSA